MHSFFLFFLGFAARMIIKIHKPFVIGVTGTVGKTTITSNIATYFWSLFGKKEVQISPYHYNGEYGLPLSIIWVKTGWRNPFRWLWVFLVAFYRCLTPYPKYLILEYGVDHPGEMKFLLSIAQPDIAIIAPISPNHLEQFWTLQEYRREKLLILQSTKKRIVHESLRSYVTEDALYYGTGSMSDVDASNLEVHIQGVTAQIHVYKNNYNIELPTFGMYQIENILPLYAVAYMMDFDMKKIAEYAYLYAPEPGRSNIISGINESTIVDGSYNGGFESISRGIDSVIPFLAKHKVFIFLWDMRELGDESKTFHEKLAEYILENIHPEYSVHFYLVWPLMETFVFPILSQKYPTFSSLSSRVLGKMIQKEVQKTENKWAIIYVKWSQNTIFLEEGIKFLLTSETDKEKLCRQSEDWMKKKDVFFASLRQ